MLLDGMIVTMLARLNWRKTRRDRDSVHLRVENQIPISRFPEVGLLNREVCRTSI